MSNQLRFGLNFSLINFFSDLVLLQGLSAVRPAVLMSVGRPKVHAYFWVLPTQYSLGRKKVVTDRSHSVISQIVTLGAIR